MIQRFLENGFTTAPAGNHPPLPYPFACFIAAPRQTLSSVRLIPVVAHAGFYHQRYIQLGGGAHAW